MMEPLKMPLEEPKHYPRKNQKGLYKLLLCWETFRGSVQETLLSSL